MRSVGLPGDVVDFQMPVWTPGYYGRFDYAAGVRDFTATDDEGREMPWDKVGPNTWRVAKGKRAVVRLAYNVIAKNPFVADGVLRDPVRDDAAAPERYLGFQRSAPPRTFSGVSAATSSAVSDRTHATRADGCAPGPELPRSA